MNILLIEDDIGLVELITEKLEELEFSVISATSGAETLALLEKQTPDLMLLDYSLPDITGKELVEKLNQQQIPSPPFIITTGQGDERIAVDMMKLGAMDYLVKDTLFLKKLPNVVQRVIKEIESDGKLKQAEDELKKQSDLFKLVINTVPDRIFWKDLNSVYLGCNKNFAIDAGMDSTDNVIGKGDEAMVWGKDADIYREDDQLVINTGEPKIKYDEEFLNTDGQKVVWRTSKMPLKNIEGEIIGVVAASENVTEEKKIAQKLKDSEEKFRLLYNNSPDMYASVLADDATILMCNDTFLKSMGYSREEVIGVPLFKMYHDDCIGNVKAAFQQFSETGEVNNCELILKRKDGSKIDVNVKGYSIRDESGKIISSMTSWRDITEQKKAEEEVKRYHDNLEEIVQVRTKELKEQNKKLDDAMKVFVGRELTIRDLQKRIQAMGGKL